MNKNNVLIFVVLGLMAGAGFWKGDFFGGLLVGASILLGVLATIGQSRAAKAAGQIDKTIRDHIANRQTATDGNPATED